jgi:hypothetical protein
MVTRKPQIAIVIPTIWGFPHIDKTIKNAAVAVRRNGGVPRFAVTYKIPMNPQIRDQINALGEEVAFLPVKGRLGKSMIRGFSYFAKKTEVDVMTMLPDDFDEEAKGVYSTIKPVVEGKAEFVTGSWRYHPPTKNDGGKTFPEPQYHNEINTTRLATIVNPELQLAPNERTLSIALSKAEKEGKLMHTYTGLLSMRRNQWPSIKRSLDHVFGDQEHIIDNFAIEYGLLLSAMHAKKKIAVVPSRRRYEHEQPSPQNIVEIRKHRLSQFNMAARLTRHFLEKTGQQSKRSLVQNVSKHTRARIKGARPSRPLKAWERAARLSKNKKWRDRFPAIKRRR